MRRLLFFYLILCAPVYAEVPAAMDKEAGMREEMVESQLRPRGIQDERVLAAMQRVPRHEFVPADYRAYAYADSPLSIGHNQTISQPYIVAYMSEALQINPGDKVLEIGTGSGYQAAVLAELGAEVYSVEIVEPLHRMAAEALRRTGYENVHLRLGNGWLGWPEEAPFDKIIVTAAPDKIPQSLVDQLKEGGRLIVPVGSFMQALTIGVKTGGVFQTIETIPVRFVPLVAEPREKEGR